MTGPRSREEVALRLLCAYIQAGAQLVGENEIAHCFQLAIQIEKHSAEVGGRPVRTVGRRWDQDEDED